MVDSSGNQQWQPSPEYLARLKRVNDAVELKQPDRIPILLAPGYLMAEMGKITRQELHENPAKAQEILGKLALQFKPDIISGVMGNPAVSKIMGDTMCIIGGMPVSMLSGSSVQQIREYTHKLCEQAGKDGGYIMSTGTLELEGCKPELIKAWVDATKEFGTY